ncbi:MAG: DUF3108 domain-containing protein [Gammaproteobacteria bacterium]
MRPFRLFAMLIATSTLLGAPAFAQDGTELAPFEARYKVRMSGLSGRMTMSLAHEDGRYQARSYLKPKGFATLLAGGELEETVSFDIAQNRVRPLSYQLRDTIARNDKRGALTFDWDAGTASGDSDGTPLNYDIDTLTLDRLSLQYALMLDLLNGRSAPGYTMLDGERRKNLTISQAGDQTIKVPFGRFEVREVRHQNQGSSRRTILYCAKELGYLPVRIEQYKNDDLRVRADLVEHTPR